MGNCFSRKITWFQYIPCVWPTQTLCNDTPLRFRTCCDFLETIHLRCQQPTEGGVVYIDNIFPVLSVNYISAVGYV